ncbi:hypothetical protein AUR64_04340 [Haloprofundus marisrubri]|uniref:Uncharacterized protein n=1 Tax=Haloprofundus marisrubri TaxID=1514971 RepID=A0A0W1RDG1_9EURY|nr:hypothetical protein [Haloprofundus marisrubri]KTG11487.1 hypothetical protein AUR64_04340 [Haloprofundus marisrubri]
MEQTVEELSEQLSDAESSEKPQLLVEALKQALGESLRTVAYGDFRQREYNILYADPATFEQYSPEDIEEIADDVKLEEMAAKRQSDLYDPLGDLEMTIRVFGDGINVIARATGEGSTIYIGIDGEKANLFPVMELLEAYTKS